MSEYEYTYPTSSGPDLTICGFEDMAAHVWISSNHQPGGIGSYIPNADAPTVAAELLKAAGHEATILPKTGDIVRERTDKFIIGFGQFEASVPRVVNPELVRVWAANYIALAEYIESKAQRETEAEAAKKLQERRDEVKAELVKAMLNHTEATDIVRTAIDRIIELEDGQVAA